MGCRRRSPRSTRRRSTWCLARPALRDIALVQWCGGMSAGDEALDAQLRWESGEEYPAHLAMQMWGRASGRIPTGCEAALALSRRIAAAAPRGSARRRARDVRAGSPGRSGARPTRSATRSLACEIEPEHGLAEIVRSFVLAGHLPDWAFQRPPRAKRAS